MGEFTTIRVKKETEKKVEKIRKQMTAKATGRLNKGDVIEVLATKELKKRG